jgi:NitT/TauT family transport system ATP-binding protein
VATSYPKCSPTEMFGLLVLLDSHKGSEDVALLARDLDLEIDEIFPALEYSEVLGLVQVADGRATFTDMGRKFVAASIRERKALLREQLKRTTLFKTLLRALETSPEQRLSDEELGQIFSFTNARADDAVQNIVNWGRYADLFRYDSEERSLLPTRRASGPKAGGGRSPPPSTPSGGTSTPASKKPPAASPPETTRPGALPAFA